MIGDALRHLSHPGILDVPFKSTEYYLKARYRFLHPEHTISEPDWCWPTFIPQLPYDHEKDGI